MGWLTWAGHARAISQSLSQPVTHSLTHSVSQSVNQTGTNQKARNRRSLATQSLNAPKAISVLCFVLLFILV